MSDQATLKAAIEKAIANGWKTSHAYGFKAAFSNHLPPKPDQLERLIPQIVFSHDFAKAFWGEVPVQTYERFDNNLGQSKEIRTPKLQPWQYHLQQMVLEEDPLKYLERFL